MQINSTFGRVALSAQPTDGMTHASEAVMMTHGKFLMGWLHAGVWETGGGFLPRRARCTTAGTCAGLSKHRAPIPSYGLAAGAPLPFTPLMNRPDGRQPDQLRPISFIPNVAAHATGSVLVSFGDTRVICSATIEEDVPRWMRAQKVEGGWLTAEYLSRAARRSSLVRSYSWSVPDRCACTSRDFLTGTPCSNAY